MKVYYEKLRQMKNHVSHIHEEIDSLKNELYDVYRDVERIATAMEKDMAKAEKAEKKDCATAEKTADGKCVGYQKSKIDDEPADMCMYCKLNVWFEGE